MIFLFVHISGVVCLPTGEADKTKKKAETLARHFKEPIVVRHAGGRIVPVLGMNNAY